MNGKGLRSILHTWLLSLMTAILLSGCGGGGGGGDGAGGFLDGTAATGVPVDGIVYVTDSNGIEVNAPVGPDGYFSLSMEGMTPPFLLRVVPNGVGEVLYSFASEENITVNITPLTTLALFLAYNGDLDTLYDAWSANTDALDDATIEDKQELINANLFALFGDHAVDASFYDFLHVAFETDGTGIDGVLDALQISFDFFGDTFSVLINGTPYTWNPDIDTTAINIGDFGIPAGSLWLLTVSDSANDIQFSEQVLWSFVPNDLDQFAQLGENDIMAEFTIEGLNVSVNISGTSFEVAGNGEVGTVITGRITGNVHVSGEFEGQTINETVNLKTLFEWERLDDLS